LLPAEPCLGRRTGRLGLALKDLRAAFDIANTLNALNRAIYITGLIEEEFTP
jgi:hypothetical protein